MFFQLLFKNPRRDSRLRLIRQRVYHKWLPLYLMDRRKLNIILDEVHLLNRYYSYETLQSKTRKYGAVDQHNNRTYGQRVKKVKFM